jgi:BA14K-like protein
MGRITSLLAGFAILASSLTTPAFALSQNFRAPIAVPSNLVQVAERNVFLRKKNGVYLNGMRGERRWRNGYRRSNGYWFPAAAFLGGVIIGGVIANSDNFQGGRQHVRWCQNRYRSYRINSNSFQPYNGPRRICYSPYY